MNILIADALEALDEKKATKTEQIAKKVRANRFFGNWGIFFYGI